MVWQHISLFKFWHWWQFSSLEVELSMRLEPWTNNLTQVCMKLLQKDALSGSLDNKSLWRIGFRSNFYCSFFVLLPFHELNVLFVFSLVYANFTHLCCVWLFNVYKNKSNVKMHKIFQNLLSWNVIKNIYLQLLIFLFQDILNFLELLYYLGQSSC